MKEKFIRLALKEAYKAYKKNEVPVGAVIVKNNKVIAKASNNRQKNYSVIGHAEILAILKAEKKLKDWRLDGLEMYVTLYPCKMCQTLIDESRLSKVCYLIDQEKVHINSNKYVKTNVCSNEINRYQKILSNFFQKMRK